jgi:hypothetical protein
MERSNLCITIPLRLEWASFGAVSISAKPVHSIFKLNRCLRACPLAGCRNSETSDATSLLSPSRVRFLLDDGFPWTHRVIDLREAVGNRIVARDVAIH